MAAKHKRKKKTLSNVAKNTSKGGLHRSLGIPQDEKIGMKRIKKAEHSKNPKTRKQARLAETYAEHRPKKKKTQIITANWPPA